MTLPMTMQTTIETKVQERLAPQEMQVENESHMHGGPATESHFKLTAVSDEFSGLNLVKRHQLIYGLLKEEMAGSIHALALHLYTPEEWAERSQTARQSPDCRGGSKADIGGAAGQS